eukprot:GHVU01142571.1.p2 GENE.GHVU01142571.1~~GHVU01142571.1.p2  ORF type:complete len:112 (-),score=5.96 GHVU01142571.1:160-495(-)
MNTWQQERASRSMSNSVLFTAPVLVAALPPVTFAPSLLSHLAHSLLLSLDPSLLLVVARSPFPSHRHAPFVFSPSSPSVTSPCASHKNRERQRARQQSPPHGEVIPYAHVV